MKNALLFLVFVVVVVLVSSCKKEDTLVPQKNDISVFVKNSSGLKSEQSPIQQGDTIELPRMINVVFSVQKNGSPIKMHWAFIQEVGEYHLLSPTNTSFGDQVSNLFLENGYYKVSIGPSPLWDNPEFFFFVYVSGIPGKLGDGPEHHSIFRLEKRIYWLNNSQNNYLFLYFKYDKKITEGEKAYLFLRSHFTNHQNEVVIKLKKYPFGENGNNYYYCYIQPNTNVKYFLARFVVSQDGGLSGYIDINNFMSSWSGIYGIEFAAP